MGVNNNWFLSNFELNPFSNGGLFDETGGTAYKPPPDPSPLDFLIKEADGFNILQENLSRIVLE